MTKTITKRHGALALLAAFLAVIPVAASAKDGPSFDCTKASTSVERAICADPELSAADALMAELYTAAKTSAFGTGPSNQLAVQRQWLKDRGDRCDGESAGDERRQCLLRAYDERNEELAVATLFRNPELSLQTLRRVDAAVAPAMEAVYLFASERGGADWSSADLAAERAAIERLLTPAFRHLQTGDHTGFGADILADDGITQPPDVVASEKNFATFLNVASAYLDGQSVVIPCEALLRRPVLLGAIESMFGSTLDAMAARSDCHSTLPPLPALDHLTDAISAVWPPCDGTIRFAFYRGFATDTVKARLGRVAPGEDLPSQSGLPVLKGVSPGLVKKAVANLSIYYRQYDRASPERADRLARAHIAKLMSYEDAGC